MTHMMTGLKVRDVIDQMRRETKSKAARVAMAKAAIARDNLTDDGRAEWQLFLDEQGK